MTTRYITNSPELVKQVLGLPTIEAVLAFFRQSLEIATNENRPSLADAARELALLWCDQAAGNTIEVVAK